MDNNTGFNFPRPKGDDKAFRGNYDKIDWTKTGEDKEKEPKKPEKEEN